MGINLSGKKILITGGAGFIGSALANFLDTEDCEICIVDKFRSDETFSNGNLKSFGHFKNLIGFTGDVLEGDIAQERTICDIRDFAPDIIYHQAAISDTTVREQDELIRTNVNTFKSLLKICKELDAKMIYASSGATYGNAPSPQKVGRGENPGNVYGFSKLMMDHMGRNFSKKYGTHVVGLRYFNVYGKGEYYKNKTASMVLQFGLQILNNQAPKLFEGSDKIKRDFIYIKDVVQANLCALGGKSGVYNVGTGIARSFQDIADILQKELGRDLGNIYIPNPFKSQYQFHTEAQINQTKLGMPNYSPKFSLEDGIKDYLPEIKKIFEENLNA